MRDLLEHGVSADDHAAEFDHLERFAVQADPLLPVEHRPPATQLDGQGDQKQQGQAAHQGQAGERDVERPLLKPLGAVVLRLLDVDQRQAGHRAHVQPRPGHIDDTGCDEQVDVEALQFPGQVTQAGAVELLGGRDCDSVAATGHDGPRDRRLVAEDRDFPDARDADGGPGVLPRNTGADDVVSRPGLSRKSEGEIPDRLGAADDQQAGDTPAFVYACPDHRPAGDPPGHQQQKHAGRQRDHQVPAGDFQFEEHGDDRDGAEHRDRRPPDPPILLDAGADNAGGSGAVDGQCRHPPDHDRDRNLDVGDAGEHRGGRVD